MYKWRHVDSFINIPNGSAINVFRSSLVHPFKEPWELFGKKERKYSPHDGEVNFTFSFPLIHLFTTRYHSYHSLLSPKYVALFNFILHPSRDFPPFFVISFITFREERTMGQKNSVI